MEKTEIKERLALISRAGTVILIALYGAGFLVVSFHDASYGIVEFGVFRTRLLSAGVIFGVFLGLPLLEASRVFGLFGVGVPEPRTFGHDKGSKPRAPGTRLDRLFLFFSGSWIVVFFMRWLVGDFSVTLSLGLLWVGYAAISAMVFASLQTGVGKKAARIFMVPIVVGALVALVGMKEWDCLWLLFWFANAGSLACQMDPSIRDPRKLLWANWHLAVVNIIGVFAIFAIVLYPKIPPAFGGGQPTKVVLQFAAASPIGNSAKPEVWLVDETEEGYYVIQAPTDHKAIFIPRSLVSAVYFEPSKPAL